MAMPRILNNFTAANGVKKALDEKYQERMKICGYIGMEVYDLYKQNKVSVPEVEMHFEKLKAIEKDITDLEAEKQRLESESRKTGTCSCGCALSGQERFCPKCGKPVDNGELVCTCGKTVKKDMMFCPYCGKNVKELSDGTVSDGKEQRSIETTESENNQTKYRECICGARVLEGQNMCMECGRMVGI